MVRHTASSVINHSANNSRLLVNFPNENVHKHTVQLYINKTLHAFTLKHIHSRASNPHLVLKQASVTDPSPSTAEADVPRAAEARE